MSASSSDPASLRIIFGSHTDVGKRRENNEDSSRCATLDGGAVDGGTLLMVSDGVGGATAGEIASRTAVDSVHELIAARLARETPPTDRRSWIDDAVRETDQRIRALATGPGLAGMAATASILWLANGRAWWGQAGDSRIYRYQKGELRQITRDQSPVGRLRADGGLTEEQARAHPYRHLIDQCLGGSGPTVEPDTGALALQAGDIFLLCSDGLSDGLWDADIAEGLRRALAEDMSPDEAARSLVNRANELSGKDNITAVVAYAIGGPTAGTRPPWYRRLWT